MCMVGKIEVVPLALVTLLQWVRFSLVPRPSVAPCAGYSSVQTWQRLCRYSEQSVLKGLEIVHEIPV